MELSFEQQMAVETSSKKVVVAAGAGSGKTLVLIERIRFLLDHGVNPDTIFAITYTNNAAQEISKRLKCDRVFVGTIHGLANRILIASNIDTSFVIKNDKFDDLFQLVKTRHPKIPFVDHLLVDEFQDICDNEYEFISQMLKPKHFFYIGDSRQAIYSFKGSNYKIFNNLTETPGVQVCELIDNYRNPRNIVKFATHFIAGMEDIYMTDVNCVKNVNGTIVKRDFLFSDLMDRLKTSGSFGDWFVLCRTNRQIEFLLDWLKEESIPAITFKKGNKSNEEMAQLLKSNVVKVLTIHSAKGLEAPNVAVIGARNFSHEERRLEYVAATRAKNNLIWYYNFPAK